MLCLLAAAALAGVARAGEDLAERYPATLDHSDTGLEWTCDAGDVWRLSAFEIGRGKDLQIKGRAANVVFGRHDSDVLWAVVFPDTPVKIASRLAGNGEKSGAILLRFNGHDIERLFPEKTVKGEGEGWLRARAVRLFRRKLGWKWFTPSGNPTIVPRSFLIVDADTDAGSRRFFAINTTAGSVEYLADFEGQAAPPLAPITSKEALAAFDTVWETFDREYAMFGLVPEVDWDRARKRYRASVEKTETTFDAAAVIADMLAELRDLHVWVRAGEDYLPGFTRHRPLNGSWQATQGQFSEWNQAGKDLWWGRTEDGIGYLNVTSLGDAELPAQLDAALESLGDTWALVLDLRWNGGGDELLAQQIASRFVEEERVYSRNRYRSGPAHDDLGPLLDRTFAPREPWRYVSPVVCLWGRKTMSSAVSFALLMEACPQVVTMGQPTAGSSANPRLLELECGITVNVPRWLDLTPDGQPIEHVGVPPEIVIDADESAFTPDDDPVIEAALARLRAIPTLRREAGKRPD